METVFVVALVSPSSEIDVKGAFSDHDLARSTLREVNGGIEDGRYQIFSYPIERQRLLKDMLFVLEEYQLGDSFLFGGVFRSRTEALAKNRNGYDRVIERRLT